MISQQVLPKGFLTQINMFSRSIFLLLSFLLGASFFWLATKDSWIRSDQLANLNKEQLIELRKGFYLFSLSREYRLAISVEDNGQFSLRLHDKSNSYSNHFRFSGAESFISVSRKIKDSTVVVVDKDLDGLPEFRVISSKDQSEKPTKKKLSFLVEP